MVRIRLARHGKKNDPFYRIVVIEKTRKNKGKALDVVGHWHPKSGEKKIEKDKIKEWISRGAQPSKAVMDLVNK